MATPGELIASMETALQRGQEAQTSAVRAMGDALGRVKATGVRVAVQESADGVQARFTENPRSRAQVRLNPADVASKAAERASRVGQEALEQTVGRS